MNETAMRAAKRFLSWLIVLAICGPVLAQTTTERRELKLGVVDLAQVFKAYDKSAMLEKRINAEREEFQDQLTAQKNVISDLTKELDLLDMVSQSYQLKEEEKAVALARFKLMKRRIDVTMKQRFEDYNLELLDDIEAVVQEYGKERAFTLILKVQTQPLDSQKLLVGLKNVLYFADELDITKDVIVLLNRRYALDAANATKGAPEKTPAPKNGGS